MSGRGWFTCSNQGNSSQLKNPPQDKGIHIYLFRTPNGERFLSHTSGDISTEDLCIFSAEAVGISPLCHVLFALYDPHLQCWYSPNDILSPENGPLVLHYCMRFYFRNWHGLNKEEPSVVRYGLKGGTDSGTDGGQLVLDIKALEYLFSQAKYEFVNELVQIDEMQTEEEMSHFKNESLAMAVLHLLHEAVQEGCTLQSVAKRISFESCIPQSFAKIISEDKILTKIRIRWMFEKFVRTFQETMDKKQPGLLDIMYKYILTLEHLAPCFGTEMFSVSKLKIREEGYGSIFYSNPVHAQRIFQDNSTLPPTHEIMVSGVKGIHFRVLLDQKAKRDNYLGNGDLKPKKCTRQPSQTQRVTSNTWTSFCDFPEITLISIDGDNVCISTLQNHCMEFQMKSSQEARSFVSLIDGYYRLTANPNHYFCREVAPPRVVLSEANQLHGPMQDGFVRSKLKKEATTEGVFLVRWSVHDYHRMILAVLNPNENGSISNHKQFRIQYNGSKFHLHGWEQEFSSVKELTESLKDFAIKSGPESYSVKKCCSPKHGDLSNLLVMRQGSDSFAPKGSVSIDKLNLCFCQIKERDIKQEDNLGRGTRTKIYSGYMLKQWNGQNGESNNNFTDKKERVVLKTLEQSHKNIALAFFETASIMNQISHCHLVRVHGLSVKGQGNIMVEEFVEFGPLDVFLRREKASLTPKWKFIVAKQLASALTYFGSKQLVHGKVCAKNILVARPGLEEGSHPFVKLSDPGIALNMLSRVERVEHIPWIAPECIDSDSSMSPTADQWSFGGTLVEIFNNGYLPYSDSTLCEKESFYERKGHLPDPPSQELASFIRKCRTYDPTERPSFWTLLRDLTLIVNKNPDISPSETHTQKDSNVYHKRYLKELRDLGEGHFGKVTLCRYDPANNGEGELVALKTLKQERGFLLTAWLKEIETIKTLNHTNIVKYKGSCTEMGGQVVQLIMEYLPYGSLKDYLPKHQTDTTTCLLYARQICEGMAYLHTQRYVHRDLAARNVLMENDNLVKIGDFGLTKHIPEGKLYYHVHEDGDSPVYWYAIECLKDKKFSFASDVWSFGVTLYEILTRCNPSQSPPTKFSEMLRANNQPTALTDLVKLLEKNGRLPLPRDSPEEVKILMKACWATEPEQRPSFQYLIQKLGGQPFNMNSNFM